MNSCVWSFFVAAAASLSAPVVAGASGSAPMSASAPLSGIVVDSTGAAMGPFYPAFIGQQSAVLLSIGGQPVLVPLGLGSKDDPAGMVPDGNGQDVFYESTDCSGAGWVTGPPRFPGTAPAVIVATSATDAIVFLASTKLSKDMKNFRSQFFKVGQCVASNVAARAYAVEQAIDLASLYAVPYHLQ